MSPGPANLLTAWSDLLLGSLAQVGIRDVVSSPGSRSTPFLLAAARRPEFRVHSLIDERSAAFFALGQARATGRPSLLLCTSGTAGAHYLPAIIEAGAAYTPLLVLTADRPLEMQGCAAPQTIDQIKLFAGHVRAYFELGLPDESSGALLALRRMAAQAVLATGWPSPGAVHMNARARKPLEARGAEDRAAEILEARVRSLLAAPLPRPITPRPSLDDELLAQVLPLVHSARRGLIICGPAKVAQGKDLGALFQLAQRTGFPLLAEATSQLRFAGAVLPEPIRCDLFEAPLRNTRLRQGLVPDLILQLGAPPTSSAWDGYLAAHPGCPRVVIAAHGWNDPRSDAAILVAAEPGEFARALTARLGGTIAADSSWRELWRTLDLRARKVIELELERAEPSEGAMVAAAVDETALSAPRSMLFIGNSLPIREVDELCPGTRAELSVLCQRGANGIDGLISGAAGAAAADGRPVTLLIGDVSFLHDIGGLAATRGLVAPLVIVVLNNRGGRIFEQLPIGQAPADRLDLFTTPHDLDLSHAARLYSCAFFRAGSPGALRRAIRQAHGRSGCTVIEAMVPPGSAAALRQRLDGAIAEALAEMPLIEPAQRSGGSP